jgi:hypothetical protein
MDVAQTAAMHPLAGLWAFVCCLAGAAAQDEAPLRTLRTIDLLAHEAANAAPRTDGKPATAGDPRDVRCRAVALSSDGRFVVAVVAGGVLVAGVDDGAVTRLPIDGGSVRAVAAAGAGGDVLVVTQDQVQRWDAARAERLRTFALPQRAGRTVEVRQACAGSGSLVALRGWFGLSPWVALLDHDSGRWREFAFAHGSMDWSVDGRTLVVGSGGPSHFCDDPDVVRRVPRDGGDHTSVATPGYHFVTTLPGGAFLGSDSAARAYLHDGAGVHPVPGVVWHGCVALSADWLLVVADGLVLRTVTGTTARPVLRQPVVRLGAARAVRRVVAATRGALHVFEWDARLPPPPTEPTPRKRGSRPGSPW